MFFWLNSWLNRNAPDSDKTKAGGSNNGSRSSLQQGSHSQQPLQVSSYLKEKDQYKAFLCEQHGGLSGTGNAMAESLRTWEKEWARRNPNEAKDKSKLAVLSKL